MWTSWVPAGGNYEDDVGECGGRMCTTSGGGARRQRWAAGPGSASRVKPVEPAAALQSEIDCRAEHIELTLNLKTAAGLGGKVTGDE